MKHKGIPMKWAATLLFLIVGVLMILSGLRISAAGRSAREQVLIEENLRACIEESQNFSDASDYLTSEAWHFVTTGNLEHLNNYWNEVNNSRNRNAVLDSLRALSLSEAEISFMENALNESNRLIEKEAWAMRLIADSQGIADGRLPDELSHIQYGNGEDALTAGDKAALAVQYIFGQEYMDVKNTIRSDIQAFQQQVRKRKVAELSAAVSRTEHALFICRVLMLSLVLTFTLQVILFYVSLARPFSRYTALLNLTEEGDFAPLPPMGFQETRSFTDAFNRIYYSWQHQKQRLIKEQYRFRVALENTSDIVYEYDVLSDTLTSFGTLEHNSFRESRPGGEHTVFHFLSSKPDKMTGPACADFFRQAINSRKSMSVELPIFSPDSTRPETWVRITATPIPDKDGTNTRLIGKISNIQSEKEKEFALEDIKNRDSLTGFYQKEAGIRKIRKYMASRAEGSVCCLMILDLDEFASINDAEGHIFADAVLQDTADIVRAKLGPEDIAIRLGGDEFMLFITDCPKSRATVLGPEIAEALQNRSLSLDSELIFSASIGMCVTEVANDYNALYRCAESALKYVKEHTKGKAACYLDTSNELGVMLTQVYPDSHRITAIDHTYGAKDDLSSFALELLGKARNLDDAIFLLLARTGKLLGLDRVLILELDPEYIYYKITHQWYQNKADRLSYETRYLTREQLREFSASYDDQGLSTDPVFTCSADMGSVLHAGIFNYGECVGAMSFEHRGSHSWTGQERELLLEITRIISSFTLKARADAVSRAKTDFLSRMSHEIRTPMNAITGMTTIARAVPGNPPKTLDCLSKIEASNKYLLSLINDILDMSRIESGRLELNPAPIMLQKLAVELENLMRPQAEQKGLSFTASVHMPPGLCVMADMLRLNQILINLLGNAVKFTPEGGDISLTMEAVEKNSDAIQVLFRVTDTGIGISAEARDRIFNAFEQAGADTASNYGGTGLGLSISSRLVQMMGGSLELESSPGKGSSFFFTLPLPYGGCDPSEEIPEKDPDPRAFPPPDCRLLVAEDNPLNREIAEEILRMHGFLIETAENGREALDKFSGRAPFYYAAILMDIRMPVMDGLDATRHIRTLERADSRSIPIIAMTANAFDDDMKKSMENGMNGHISKPLDVEKLLGLLQKLIS